ncbi:hypothetical protein K9M59_03705 [Candidatus Gracilibacteria bacterium]|nr:hypothetical protein [Candidatus Gracilibacteria bacterium]MCF7819428.1 hypothetical protein [Candidatus Gracilibacteria bacterium]
MKINKALLQRSLREGSIQVWRNKFLSGTTILLGALIIFLLNFVFAVRFFADYSLENLESRADFSVVLQEDYDAFEFDALKNELSEFAIQPQLLEAETYEGVDIPPRLYIQFDDLSQVSDVFEVLKKDRYTANVVGEWDREGERDFVHIVDQLLRVQNGVNTASLWLGILFLAGGVLLAFNTFRIVLFSRKDEVFIARLVGADPKFILGPFLVEGALLGLCSALLGILLFVFVLREIEVLPRGQVFLYLWNSVFSWEIFCTGLVGVLGAWIAVRKYLKGKFGE